MLCLRDQDCFRTERQWETLLSILPSDRGDLAASDRLVVRCADISPRYYRAFKG